MSEKIIVLVTDRGDSSHGEISMVDDPVKAEKLVETLLEAGFEQERIHVFAGRENDFQVSQRPVVALVGEGEEDEPHVEMAREEAAAPEPHVEMAREEAAAPEPTPDARETESGDTQGEGTTTSETEEEVAATAEAAGPVKFSSLFRSA